jgi:undecaprenyl-diphosphatase
MSAKFEARTRSLRAAVAAAALAVVWFAMLTVGTGGVDDNILRALYVGSYPLLVTIARGFTWLGDWRVVIAISIAAAAWLLIARGWRPGLAVLAVTLVGRGLVTAQKYGIERLRPDDERHLVHVITPSFPSGHAAGAMILYLMLALVLTTGTRWKWPAVIAALSIVAVVGLSRVMLGVHWPSDVIGGWAFGLLWVMLALPLAERLMR